MTIWPLVACSRLSQWSERMLSGDCSFGGMGEVAIRFSIPYPPSELNPNKRLHWAQKIKLKNQQLDSGFKAASDAMVFESIMPQSPFVPARDIPIHLTFHPSTKRAFDLDNALAASKSAIDGIAKAMYINDKQFNPVTLWRGEPDKTAPRVEIHIALPEREL